MLFPGVGVGIGVPVKVLGAGPFPSNYNLYLDQTCMFVASRNGHYDISF